VNFESTTQKLLIESQRQLIEDTHRIVQQSNNQLIEFRQI